MIGYATDETKECMPYSHLMCIRLVKRLVECRVNKILPWVGPDAKV
jgi:S-adenosylmethionine synthetase